MRMHAFINLNRICEQDTEFHGVQFRAGDNIVVPSFVTDRDERTFADPDTFNPDRSKKERNQHHAFGAGAHKVYWPARGQDGSAGRAGSLL
jgi:cytochrome P450